MADATPFASNTFHVKDPDARKRYQWDWAPHLGEDTIATSQVLDSVPAGLTLEGAVNTATTATVTVSGGTVGTGYTVTNRVTTAAGDIHDCTKHFHIDNR